MKEGAANDTFVTSLGSITGQLQVGPMPYTLGIYIPHTHTIHIYIYIPHTTYHIHIYIPHTKVYSIDRTWSWPVMLPRLVTLIISHQKFASKN